MMKFLKLLVAGCVGAMLSGCTPEEVFVLVKASELQKAVAGGLGTAKIEMIFSMDSSNDPKLPLKIREAALPHLGKDAVIEIERTEKKRIRSSGRLSDEEDNDEKIDESLDSGKIVARFNIPVGTAESLANAPKSIMWLKYRPETKSFVLVKGNGVTAMNRALDRVDDSVSFDYNGGADGGKGTLIKVVSDAGDFRLGVAAVKVNGRNVLAGMVGAENGAIRISYNNAHYSSISPVFTLGEMPSLNGETQSKSLDETGNKLREDFENMANEMESALKGLDL